MALYPAKVTARPLWTPEFISPTAWYDASDESTITKLGTRTVSRYRLIDTSGINPFTGQTWQAGDVYRIIFVTEGLYDALSADLSTYDAIVQAEAEAAGLNALEWKAIVSSASEDARDHVGARIGVDYDGPVYCLGGVPVTRCLADLWQASDSTLILNKPQCTPKRLIQAGSNLTVLWTPWTGVWTGTDGDGTKQNPMGGSPVNLGILTAEEKFWLDRSSDVRTDAKLCLYGMSPPLFIREVDLVSQLADKVGTNHLVQTVEADRPSISPRKLNDLNAIEFGGSQDFDFTSGIDMLNKMAWLVIAADKYTEQQLENNGNATQTRLQNGVGDDGLELRFAGSDQTTDYGSLPTTSQAMSQFYASTPHVMGWSYGDPMQVFRDGRVESVRDRQNTNAITTIRFGDYSAGGAGLSGVLCEYIITPILSREDRQKMEGYLAHKWGGESRLPDTHPYKTHPPRQGLPPVAGSWTPDQTDLLTWLEFAWDKNNLEQVSDNVFHDTPHFVAPDQIHLHSDEGDVTSRYPKGAVIDVQGAGNDANDDVFEVESSTYGTMDTFAIDEFDDAAGIYYIYFDAAEGNISRHFRSGATIIVSGAAQGGNNGTFVVTGSPAFTGGRTRIRVTTAVVDEGPGSAASGALQGTAITTVETTIVTEVTTIDTIVKTVRVTTLYNKKGRDAQDYGISAQTSKGSVRESLLNNYRGYDNEHGGYYNPNVTIPASGDFGMLMVVKVKDIDNAGQDLRSCTGGTEGYALQPNSSSQFNGRIATTSNGNVDFASTPISDGSFHLLGVRFDYTGTGKFTGRLDGDVDTPEGTYTTKLDGTGGRFLSGPTGTQHPHAVVCEMVEFEDVSDAFYQKMEGYLAWKWGLEGSLPVGHPYKSAPPRVDE